MWLGSPLCLATKMAITRGLSIANFVSKRYQTSLKYPQLRSLSTILQTMKLIEYDPRMVKRWDDFHNVFTLLLNEDPAYFMRLNLVINFITMKPEDFRFSPLELALYYKELTLLGFQTLADNLWDHTFCLYKKAGVDFGKVWEKALSKVHD
jgi:hypothetical protein